MSEAEKKAAFPVKLVRYPEIKLAYIRVLNSFAGDRVLSAFKAITEWAKS